MCCAVAKDLPVDDLKGQLMAAIEQQDDAKVGTAAIPTLFHRMPQITSVLLCAQLHAIISILSLYKVLC
jgi:hypothetical protein